VKPASDERTPDGGEHLAAHPHREQLLAIKSESRDDAVILTVEGDIDGLTSPRLMRAITEVFRDLDGRLLVLDLAEVQFLGSSGLRTLRESAAEATRHHGLHQLRVVVDQARPVIRPIEIAGFDAFLTLYHTVEDALTADDLR
jgi:anti-sigma B factor antagonist